MTGYRAYEPNLALPQPQPYSHTAFDYLVWISMPPLVWLSTPYTPRTVVCCAHGGFGPVTERRQESGGTACGKQRNGAHTLDNRTDPRKERTGRQRRVDIYALYNFRSLKRIPTHTVCAVLRSKSVSLRFCIRVAAVQSASSCTKLH